MLTALFNFVRIRITPKRRSWSLRIITNLQKYGSYKKIRGIGGGMHPLIFPSLHPLCNSLLRIVLNCFLLLLFQNLTRLKSPDLDERRKLSFSGSKTGLVLFWLNPSLPCDARRCPWPAGWEGWTAERRAQHGGPQHGLTGLWAAWLDQDSTSKEINGHLSL